MKRMGGPIASVMAASVGAWLMCPIDALAQSPAQVDVSGVRLGSSLDDAKAALGRIAGADLKDTTGTLAYQKYTTPHLTFGASGKVGTDPFSTMFVLYDLRPPQAVIGVARVQNFDEGRMPTTDYIRSALVEKYGKPLWESGAERKWHTMLWSYGVKMTFRGGNLQGSDLQYSSCTRMFTQSLGANALSSGNYALTIDETASNCGTWVQANYYPSDTNTAIVKRLELNATDFPRVKASRDYIYKEMTDGMAKIRAGEQDPNIRPPL